MKIEHVIVSIIAMLVLALGFLAVDYATGDTRTEAVLVIDRAHQDGRTSVGVNTAGDMVVHSSPEKYTVIVELRGDVFSRRVSPSVWASAEAGSTIRLPIRYGGISGKRF